MSTLVAMIARAASERSRGEAGTVQSALSEARSVAASASASLQPRRLSDVQARQGTAIEGLRNRLFLKYSGVDYEFYMNSAMIYRGEVQA